MEAQANLETFVDGLLKEKAFQNLEPEVEAQLKTDLLNRLDDVINQALLDALTDDKLSVFESLVDKDASKEDIQKFLSDNIENMETVVTGALLKFRELYIGA